MYYNKIHWEKGQGSKMCATHLYLKTKQNTLHILEVYISNSLKICLKMQLLFSHSVMSDSLWPHDYSMPGFPVYHYLPKLAQTQVHWVGDAIQPSRLLSPPSPPAYNLFASGSFSMSQLFASGGQSISASASVLPVNIQSSFPLGLAGLFSLLSKGFSRLISSTTIQKHQFFSTQPS